MKTGVWTLVLLLGCSGDGGVPDDASTDGTVADAPNDAASSDAAKDATKEASSDATVDAAADAIDDGASSDVIDDSPADAAPDADDSGSIDAGSFDGGKKGCLGVFCIIGDTCCNNTASANYGMCEPTSCKTCCK